MEEKEYPVSLKVRKLTDSNSTINLTLIYYGKIQNLSKHQIRTLKERGYLTSTPIKEIDILKELKKKTPQKINSDIGYISECVWCGTETLVIEKHHYPIPKKDGGKEVVDICPLCHTEFHFLKTWGILRIREDILKEMDLVNNKYKKWKKQQSIN